MANSGMHERIHSDLSKYLCVLVSGFIEQSIRDVYREYANKANPRVQTLVSQLLDEQIQSPNAKNLVELAGKLDREWGIQLEELMGEEYKSAVDSVVSNRHRIAHGQDSQVTYRMIREWYEAVNKVVEFVEDQCEE